MSHRTFFISDTHFDHANILLFKRNDGTPLREFSCIEEMNEHIIDRWNSTVRVMDKVYHQGDFAMKEQSLDAILPRLNGHKKLIRGNHDVYKLKKYIGPGRFEEVYGVRMLPKYGLILTHIPVHPRQLQGRWKVNVHGHLHSNKLDDTRYFNVSVEQINYTPIELEELLAITGELNGPDIQTETI